MKKKIPDKIYDEAPNIYKYLVDHGVATEYAEQAQEMSSQFALDISIKYEAYHVKKIQEKKLIRLANLTDSLHELATDILYQEYPEL